MTTLHPHYGPGSGKFGHIDPDNIMRQIIESDPKQDMTKAVDKIVKEAVEPLGEYVPSDLLISMLWAEGIRSYWRVKNMMEDNRKNPSKKNKRDATEIKQKVNRILVAVARKMTFAQCATAGAQFAQLAKKGKPKQVVGDVLTNEQIAEALAL